MTAVGKPKMKIFKIYKGSKTEARGRKTQCKKKRHRQI
jgi:hypothetical protein